MKKYSYSQELFFVLILATVQFSHILDFVVIMPLGPTLMSALDISPAAFAALVSSYNFSAAVSNIFFGLIADLYDRKKLLLIFIVGFSLGTFWCFTSQNYYSLLASRIVAGAFGGVLSSIVFTIVTDIVPEQRRGRAMGIVMSSFSVSSILGIPIGLVISDHYGWQYCFLFIFGISILCFLLSLVYMPNLKDHLQENLIKKSSPSLFWRSLYKTITNKVYLRSLIFMFLTSGSLFLLIPFLSPYAVKNMGIQTFELKYMYLYGGLLTIGTARVFGVLTDKIGALKLYIIVLCMAFVPIILFTHSGPTTFVKYILMGAFFMSFVSGRMIPCMTLLSTVPLLKDRGVFMSLLNSVRALGSASMTFLAGLIIVESGTGELIGFNYAGYLSIAIGFVTIALGIYINNELVKRKIS